MMTYIKLEKNGDQINVNMEGEAKDLVGMIASSMMNDNNFATFVLTAMLVLAEEGKPIHDINLN
jgi:hypothetical protein